MQHQLQSKHVLISMYMGIVTISLKISASVLPDSSSRVYGDCDLVIFKRSELILCSSSRVYGDCDPEWRLFLIT